MTTLDPRGLEAAARVKCRQDEEQMLLPDWDDLEDEQRDEQRDALRGEASDIITAYLAVTQPTVETVEGLIALGDGAVIRDKYGDVSEKRGGLWCGYETVPFSSHFMSKFLPARVIWRPHESP